MRARRFWQRWEWPIVWTAGLLAFFLGLAGFAQLTRSAQEPVSGSELLYRTLKLFVLGMENVRGPLNLPLHIARFLAPAVVGFTAVKAFSVLFREQLQLWVLRWRRGYVVICGLGRKGLELARNFRRRGRPVVVIEADEENDRIEAAREAGAVVLVGDGSDLGLLHRSGVSRASQVLVVTGDDGKNVEIALRIEHLLRGNSTLDCLVHIVDPELRALFRRHRVFRDVSDHLAVTVHDFYEDTARRLFRDYPPDRVFLGSPSEPRRVRVVIVGFGQMGENVLVQAGRIGHFANGSKLLATVIDPRAKRLQRLFEHRFPGFKHVCDAEFLDLEVDEPQVLQRLEEWGRDIHTVETFILCCDNDSRNLSIALYLLPHLEQFEIPLFARMSSRTGLASLLENVETDERRIGRIRPFGMVEDMCSLELLTNDDLDRLARAIHEDYVRRRRTEGASPEDPALRPWEHLDDDFRESCRQQADHIPVKLRAVGCYSAPAQAGKAAVSDFSNEEVELLARMEHARWCAERFLAGWTYAPGPKNLKAKTSPYLLGWESVPEQVKDYDRQAVRLIPHLVSLVGELVYRAQR